MALRYTYLVHCKTLHFYTNTDFWLENMPPGNPVWQVGKIIIVPGDKRILGQAAGTKITLGT
jgi:hypothetical protein